MKLKIYKSTKINNRMQARKLSLILVVLVILTLPICFAEVQTLGTFKQYDCITLRQTCSNCTWNNLTSVVNPSSIVLISNVEMTKSGTEYNYTFCFTSDLGQYIANGVGDINSIPTVWAYDFYITSTGKDSGWLLPLFLLLGGIIFLVIGLIGENFYMGYISGCLFVVAGVYTMIYGLGTMADMYTRTLSYISIGLGVMFVIVSAYENIESTGESND